MATTNINRYVIAATVLGTLLLTGGCQSKDKPPVTHGEQFDPQGARATMDAFVVVQAANGARNDATLHEVAFNGDQLSSQGQQKLDLMRQSDVGGPTLVVYLNVAKDTFNARRDAVGAYLKAANVKQVQLVQGPNPNVSTPAINTMAGVYHKESESFSGEAADLAIPAAGGGAGAAAGGGGGAAGGGASSSSSGK